MLNKKIISVLILIIIIAGATAGLLIYRQNGADWNIYRNTDLGFEIKYPELVADYSSCEPNGMIPIKFFERDNMIYIAKEYLYSQECERIDNTFNLLDSSDMKPWKMIFKDINNDDELDKFIKKVFWDTCRLGEKKPASQEGVFDVLTYYNGKSLDESDCFINYMTVLKYYPEKKTAVFWEIGQEENFWDKNGIGLDDEMIKSFEFIE